MTLVEVSFFFKFEALVDFIDDLDLIQSAGFSKSINYSYDKIQENE